MQTKNGVVYDLSKTPFIGTYGQYDFAFSSATHLVKFNDKVNIRVPWLNDSFSKRFHVTIDVSILAVIQLYMQVETRGFRIYDNARGRCYLCAENIILHGLTVRESD